MCKKNERTKTLPKLTLNESLNKLLNIEFNEHSIYIFYSIQTFSFLLQQFFLNITRIKIERLYFFQRSIKIRQLSYNIIS